MPLSWNEIKSRAQAFTQEWKEETNEDAEAKSFWDDFFNIFGISRRRVATFEQQVRKIDNKQGYIDLLWKGMILVEHKSRGKDLDKAYQQAKDYFPGLTEAELPKYILVSDFERFNLYNLDNGTSQAFTISELVKNVGLFSEIAGYKQRTFREQDPVNIDAAELMGKLHDKLKAIGYKGHPLEVYLVRLVFCLFADDTNIFEKGIFFDYLDLKTAEDGSNLAAMLAQLFEVLNTPKAERLFPLDESLDAFPYVNGKLFEERLPIAAFDSQMRRTLMECCSLDWGRVSPAIFGSMFQSVMDDEARRAIGAHYTSEQNIMKVIKPLFLDSLSVEFERVKSNTQQLKKFHEKISKLRFLDPACGSGNFLILAYRELRKLEIEVVRRLLKGQTVTDIGDYFLLDVDQFYGIEVEEFPAQIAQLAMWLIDHQMNMLASETFGEYYVRLPLRKSASITQGNALQLDWSLLIQLYPWEKEKGTFNYIFGNPPFKGSKMMNQDERKDIENIFSGLNGAGTLDYVSGWYGLAAQYLNNSPNTKVGLVSTNSIVQGEQVGILWEFILHKHALQIQFAHQTFQWTNEARGIAAVHCIIVGIGTINKESKRLFLYEDVQGEPVELSVSTINAYLVEGPNVLVKSRQQPVCNGPKIGIGNKPIDDGNYLFLKEEKEAFVKLEPRSEPLFRRWLGSEEFIHSKERWCLWLGHTRPEELSQMPYVLERIKAVQQSRLKSKSIPTRKLADFPTRFHVENIPTNPFLIIPKVSSEKRKYIPIGFESPDILASDLVFIVPNATLFHFGILTSIMHMAWVKTTCGRLESRYRYSKDIVYNNFPWPENPTHKQVEGVEIAAKGVLEARSLYKNSTLGQLYDPTTMPPELIKAHLSLDKAVDICYRSQPFPNETKRIEFLFELYDKYTAGLFVKPNKKLKQ